MATNEPPKTGEDVYKKPVDVHSQQQQSESSTKVTYAPDSTEHFTTQTKTQSWSANIREDPQAKPEASLYAKVQQQKPELSLSLTQSHVEKLEKIFPDNQYPDIFMIAQLCAKLKVSTEVVTDWFRNKRSEYRETEKERVLKHFQVQAMQKQQQQNLAHRHPIESHSFVSQAGGSTSYTGQQPAEQCFVFTAQHLNYLETLFTNGTRYPDIPQLTVKLNVPEHCLAVWFEKRRDAWKKEQADMAHTRMALHQEIQQRQQQDGTKTSQAPLSAEANLPEASNVPLVDQILSDISNEPTLSLLNINVDKFLR